MAQQQEDGYYPRLNAAMLNTGNFTGTIISLVGSIAPNSAPDNNNMIRFNCADGGNAQVQVDPDFGSAGQHTAYVEIVGLVNEDGSNSVQHFVTRELGDDFDIGNYNAMVELQMDPRFKVELFHNK